MIRFFRHYISSAYLWLMIGEFIVFFFAMYYGSELRFLLDPSWYNKEEMILASIIFSVILSISCSGLGLYRRSLGVDDYELLPRVCVSFSTAIFILVSIYYLFPEFQVARSVLGIVLLIAFAGMMISRFIFYKYVNLERIKRKVLVVGSGKKANALISLNRGYLFKGFSITGFIALQGEQSIVDKNLIIQSNMSICNTAVANRSDEIIIALDDRRSVMPTGDLLDCKMSGFDVMDLTTFYEREQGLISIDNIYPSWFVFSDGFSQSGFRSLGKRCFDILASLLLLVVSWPVMLITVMAICLEGRCKETVLYRQLRVGENNQNFQLIKFRSMIPDAESNGAQWADKQDERITAIGRFIRKYRIDELPQIINVLKGEMSFVGPRPERPEFVTVFDQKIPYYCERHRVKPGITGWAQLCYPYGADEYDTIQKLQYDLYYVKNYSMFLDLNIMLHTIEVVLWGKGAR